VLRPSVLQRLSRLAVAYHQHPDPLYIDGYLLGWTRRLASLREEHEFDPRPAFVEGYRDGRRDRLARAPERQ
jgi:hypothetical protein